MTQRVAWDREVKIRWAYHGAVADEDLPYVYAFVHLRSVYGAPIGEGRHRIVFRSRDGESVIKLPRNSDGELANSRELQPDNWLGARERYAKAWKAGRLSLQTGLLVIRMEVVDLVTGSYEELPSWVSAVDCSQVGYNRAGVLVAYDFG